MAVENSARSLSPSTPRSARRPRIRFTSTGVKPSLLPITRPLFQGPRLSFFFATIDFHFCHWFKLFQLILKPLIFQEDCEHVLASSRVSQRAAMCRSGSRTAAPGESGRRCGHVESSVRNPMQSSARITLASGAKLRNSTQKPRYWTAKIAFGIMPWMPLVPSTT